MIIEVEILDSTYNSKDKEYFDSAQKISEYFFIQIAIITNVNENGQLLIKPIDSNSSFLIDPNSERIHPCGYWNFVSNEILKKSDANSMYKNITSFKESQSRFC